jgi:hypothetical protein
MKERSLPADLRHDAAVVEWLLEKNQPAVRYRTLTNLLDRSEDDNDVQETRTEIGRVGWAAKLLRRQGKEGFWEPHRPRNAAEWMDFLYSPPFISTNWMGLVLSDFGLDSTDPRIRKIGDLMFEYKLALSSPLNLFYEEVCRSGNAARMMTRFGYGDDFRVRKLFDWLVEDQREDGGWNCSQGTPGTLDAWEALAAFASVPGPKRSRKMTRAIARGAEFYLERKLFEEGENYPPWFRFHYPNHYFYDILLGLDMITQLGFGDDRRLRPALEILRKKRLPNGTWMMDATHPDIGPGTMIHPDAKEISPLSVEPVREPSKWITLKALTVLKRTAKLTRGR